MNKPRSLRDQRRTETREALYRAQLRRDQIIDSLVLNADRIRKLKRKLVRLDKPTLHTGPVSVAEGKLLDPVQTKFADEMSDDLPEHLTREEQYADYDSALEGDR